MKIRAKASAFLPSATVRTPAAFLRLVCEAFGITPKRTEADNRRLIERFLLDEYNADRHPVLLLDEGQNVSSRNIDTISDLTNFQTAQTKLITVVMLAQDNLPKKLENKDAFRSRIAVVGHLDPLTLEEMTDTIAHRIQDRRRHGDRRLLRARGAGDGPSDHAGRAARYLRPVRLAVRQRLCPRSADHDAWRWWSAL